MGKPTVECKKSFLIYLGAQKAGSTWLWRYFREHPQCATPPIKELHFFDGNVSRMTRLLEENNQKSFEAEDPVERSFLQNEHRFILRAIDAFGQSECREQAFAELLLSVASDETRLVAEFTPANGMLPIARLQRIADLPVAPKFALILRDPVDRLW